MSTRIKINGRSHTVKVSSVHGFCCSAHARVDGKQYDSRDVPYGMRSAAIDNLLERVQKDHPSATIEYH